MSPPLRTYYFSDTFGGHAEPNPLKDPDADVAIATDFGSRPEERVHREFDTLGREAVVDHLLRHILHCHRDLLARQDLKAESGQALRAYGAGTGVFINSAPRIDRTNAEPFYVATACEGTVRIVTTPLSAIASVRDKVETLSYLPNPKPGQSNGLYDGREQFRSRFTPRLLNPAHGLRLEKANPLDIPAFRTDWHISYVDRFGNVVTYTPDADDIWSLIKAFATKIDHTRKSVALVLTKDGNKSKTGFCAELATSLAEGAPGELLIYQNGGIDIARKWKPNEKAATRLKRSAWMQLNKPEIGRSLLVGK